MQSETTLHPMQISMAVAEEDGHLEVIVLTGVLFPVGPSQVLPIPSALFRVPFPSKKAAKEFHENLGKAIDAMAEDPATSDLIIASDVNQANRMAQQIRQFQ